MLPKMSFFLLSRAHVKKHGFAPHIVEIGLVPQMPPGIGFDARWWDAVVLANLWLLRRKRPVVVAGVSESTTRLGDEMQYVESLPTLTWDGGKPSACSLRLVRYGDITPVLPSGEDEWLLFLPVTPPIPLPYWPAPVTILGGIVVRRTDEILKLDTVDDDEIIAMADRLPAATWR